MHTGSSDSPARSDAHAYEPTVERPGTILAAVALMYCGAVLQLAGLIVALGGLNTARLKARTADARARAGGLSDDEFSDAVQSGATIGAVVVIVVSLAAIALWIWMARSNYRGLWWARTTATVLGVLGIIGCAFSAIGADGGGTAVLDIAIAVLAVGIVALLHHRESTAFYEAMDVS